MPRPSYPESSHSLNDRWCNWGGMETCTSTASCTGHPTVSPIRWRPRHSGGNDADRRMAQTDRVRRVL